MSNDEGLVVNLTCNRCGTAYSVPTGVGEGEVNPPEPGRTSVSVSYRCPGCGESGTMDVDLGVIDPSRN